MSASAAELLHQAWELRRDHHPEQAKRVLVEAVDLSRRADSPSDLSLALTRLGGIERDLGHGEAALAHYAEAAALYRAQGNILRVAHTVRHVGDILYEAGRFQPAEACVQEALAIYRTQPNTPALDFANALRSLAVLKSDTGEITEARFLWEQLLERYTAIGIPAGIEEAARRLATLPK